MNYSDQYKHWKFCVMNYGLNDPRTRDAADRHDEYLFNLHGIKKEKKS